MENKKKVKIIAILGKSGSGKSTLADILKDKGIPPVLSCTTRPKRSPDESHHVFLSDDEFDKIKSSGEFIAETVYGGYKYAGMLNTLDPAFSYVIDEVGLNMLKKDDRFDIFSVLVIAPEEDRKKRTTTERFERDNKYLYKVAFDDVILNHRGLDRLEKYCQTLIERIS